MMLKTVRILQILIVLLFAGAAQAQTCATNPYNLANGSTADAMQFMANFNNLLNCINNQPGLVFSPMGRLTLMSGVPVMTTAVSAGSTIYYTPYSGNLVPIWTGSGFVAMTFSEVNQTLSDTTKSPGAALAGSVYDLFSWSDGGTFRTTRGPAWSTGTGGSNTARGTGAGSTALTRVNGILVNQYAIANGPRSGYGTYVGTIATDQVSPTVSWVYGSAAVNGGAALFDVWNTYNRRRIATQIGDTTASWTYASTTVHAAHGSNTFRATFVSGLAEDTFEAAYTSSVSSGSAGYASVGIGLDSTTVLSGLSTIGPNATILGSSTGNYAINLVGSHFLSAMEVVNSTNAQTFFGNNSSVLTFEGWF